MRNKITKVCSKCKTPLPLEEFNRHVGFPDGLHNWCKQCMALNQRKRLATNPEARERKRRATARWAKEQSEHLKAYYAQSIARRRELDRIRRAANPEKGKARKAILSLVKSGEIPPARDCKCVRCGKQAAHYHHHRGYARKYWNTVMPLCRSCHSRTHSKYHETTNT